MSNDFQIPTEKIPMSGTRTFLKVDQHSIVLFNIEGQFYAIEDSCPHQGASFWGSQLQGMLIRCPAHGLSFDVATGNMKNSDSMKLVTYAVEERDGHLWLVLPEHTAAITSCVHRTASTQDSGVTHG